jgi:imidazoleglycerol-phosphate dehydratase/histidinol-phosphatase
VIGDRITDIQLAKNLGCKGIWLNNDPTLGGGEIKDKAEELRLSTVALETTNWSDIYAFLKNGLRKVSHERNTNETKISIQLNMDGNGKASIHTGLGFFDHMLEQIARHGKLDLSISCDGDLHIDEHHTIEDTGIALGEAFAKALADKTGLERYGFALPMDEAEAKVLIDFGGRNWLVWNAEFKREKIGEMPTEMFFHFFKSFSDAARCNLNIECKGENEHHKIEAIFKAFAKAIRMAVKKDPFSNYLPSTKGVL